VGIPIPKVDSFSYLGERRYLALDTPTGISANIVDHIIWN
jgi:hypothetical protein